MAEAKRLLYGRVGIDMVAGPTDSMVIADASADPLVVAWDLIGQAEHGTNSPVWLVTDSPALAAELRASPRFVLPNCRSPTAPLRKGRGATLAEIILCDGPEAMAAQADRIAPEHLHVQAADLEWWKTRLRAYGSLFLGAETTVAFGDKAAGTNHVLPTSGAARYTGGLSVHKFLKTVTWQHVAAEALPGWPPSLPASAVSRGWRATPAPPTSALPSSSPARPPPGPEGVAHAPVALSPHPPGASADAAGTHAAADRAARRAGNLDQARRLHRPVDRRQQDPQAGIPDGRGRRRWAPTW